MRGLRLRAEKAAPVREDVKTWNHEEKDRMQGANPYLQIIYIR